MPSGSTTSPNLVTKQPRKPSFTQNNLQAIESINKPSIKSRLHWAFDGRRKDLRNVVRLRAIKYFHLLELKLCDRNHRSLPYLKTDKPCCRNLLLGLEYSKLYTDYGLARRHHMKNLTMMINAKAPLDLKGKFWKRIAPQVTAIDYTSNNIYNFKQIAVQTHRKRFRKLKSISFPVVSESIGTFETYSEVFSFLQGLRDLKTLYFSITSTIEPNVMLYILQALSHLPNIKTLGLTLKGVDAPIIETLYASLISLNNLKFLSLKVGRIAAKNVRELYIQKIFDCVPMLSLLSHLDLELYLDQHSKDLFGKFMQNMDNLSNLVSLNLKIDKNIVDSELAIPISRSSVLQRVKYLALEGNKKGIGMKLAKYFLGQMNNLYTLKLKNIEVMQNEGSSEDLAALITKNKELRELIIICEDHFSSRALENICNNFNMLKKLLLFSLQLHSEDTKPFNLKCLVDNITHLQNAKTIVLEALFPINISLLLLKSLFDSLSKLKKLSVLKVDLRLPKIMSVTSLKKIFTLSNIDIVTIMLENGTLGTQDQKFIFKHAKMLKKITSCNLEFENVKIDRKY